MARRKKTSTIWTREELNLYVKSFERMRQADIDHKSTFCKMSKRNTGNQLKETRLKIKSSG